MIATNTKRRSKRVSISPETDRRLLEIPLDRLDPSPHNARQSAGDDVADLAASVGDLGLLQPLIVRPKPNGRFEIVGGERRYWAAKAQRLASLPALVRELTDRDATIVNLAENLCRKSLNPIEVARGLAELCAPTDEGGGGLKQREAGRLFGKSEQWVCNLLRLLRLPDAWQRKLIAGEINRGVCKALATYADDPQVLAAVEADLAANPLYYDTWAAAERSVAHIVQRIVRAPSSPTPDPRPLTAAQKPLRAAPAVRGPQKDSPSTRRLDSVLRLIGQIREPWQLDEVRAAIDKRQARLGKAPRRVVEGRAEK